MTLIAEHVRPTSTSRSWMTISSASMIFVAAGSLAFSTDWQHWMGPVPHVWAAAEVTAARIAMEAAAWSLENMAKMIAVVNGR